VRDWHRLEPTAERVNRGVEVHLSPSLALPIVLGDGGLCSQKRSSQSRGNSNSQRPKPTVSALTTDGVLCGVRVVVPCAAA